jgi:hypothetical protein
MVPMVNNIKALRVIHRIGGGMFGVTESSRYSCSDTCNLPLTQRLSRSPLYAFGNTLANVYPNLIMD